MIGRWVRVLGSPKAAFAAHDPQVWGWALPLVLMFVLSVLVGGASLAGGAATHKLEQVELQLDAQNTPEAQREQAIAVTRAFVYAGPLVIGPVFSVVWAGFLAMALYFLGLVLQPGGEAIEIRRSLSMTSHASLVVCLGLGATLIGTLSGNPDPQTSLANIGKAGGVLNAVGSRIDPILILYYVVLAAGIQASLGFSRAVAWLVSGGLYVGVSLLAVGGAVMGQLFNKGGA